MFCPGVAQSGSAPALGAESREFESHYLDRVYLEMFEIVGSHGEHELDSLSGVLSCVST